MLDSIPGSPGLNAPDLIRIKEGEPIAIYQKISGMRITVDQTKDVIIAGQVSQPAHQRIAALLLPLTVHPLEGRWLSVFLGRQ